ncbi:MAG: hypothetical protein ACR652_09065 [Methylocystis sp.]|uniref:hypothetical protein n=1 Tax=Methylocystis sp. TaxID=1911079 RepID=UPI003DA43085
MNFSIPCGDKWLVSDRLIAKIQCESLIAGLKVLEIERREDWLVWIVTIAPGSRGAGCAGEEKRQQEESRRARAPGFY